MYELLKDFEGVVNYIDDIFLFAENVEQHDEILSKVLRHLADSGIHLNKEKCQIRKKAVTFLDHNWSDSGISLGSEKLAAIQEMLVPTMRESVVSWILQPMLERILFCISAFGVSLCGSSFLRKSGWTEVKKDLLQY